MTSHNSESETKYSSLPPEGHSAAAANGHHTMAASPGGTMGGSVGDQCCCRSDAAAIQQNSSSSSPAAACDPTTSTSWYKLTFRSMCEFCLAMPLVGLLLCLTIACLFQFGDIQETACKVNNVVPSLSAVTGISPGRYLWRVSIAFHLGPRLLIVLTYYHFLLAFVSRLKSKEDADKLKSLLTYCFYLQIAEIAGLCLISFVHNREHYPTHQKGFVVYLVASHLSYFLTLRIYDIIWPLLDENLMCSYRRKVAITFASVAFFVLMVYYYYRHFIHCDQFAFSKFATAEYFVAVTNMAFYWTLTQDLPTEEIAVIRPPAPSSNGSASVKSSMSARRGESLAAFSAGIEATVNNNAGGSEAAGGSLRWRGERKGGLIDPNQTVEDRT